jgi:four helix bundle protein
MDERVPIKSYRDLQVWQKGMELVRQIYRMTATFGGEEKFGLASQMRRAAVSIPSNIAEGYGRNSTSDYVRFVRMAIGSLYELQTQLEIALGEHIVSEEAYSASFALCSDLERMLVSLARKVEQTKALG